jgi:hypothetical protein
VPSDKTAAILAKLGFTVEGSGPWTAAVPPWRPDIVGEADLVEEVTRVFGSTTFRRRRCRACRPRPSRCAAPCSAACRWPVGRSARAA